MATQTTHAQPPETKVELKGKTAKLRDGEVLTLGDQVACSYPGRNYEEKVFRITEMTDWAYCESKMLIVAVNVNNPEEKVTSEFGLLGMDANWFKKAST